MSERSHSGERLPTEYDPRYDPRDPSSSAPVPPGPVVPQPSQWGHPPPQQYPPPPEYYQRGWPSAMPPPPPEHAYPGAYPGVYAGGYPAAYPGAYPGAYPSPDGRMPPPVYGHPAPVAGASVVAPGAGGSAAAPKQSGVAQAFLALGSALVSFALYTWWGGWQFGLGLVLLLLVHEMGHFVVIRAKGLPAALPVFIPFIGAYVAMRRMPKSVRDEAEIALAGPLAGALGGAVCFVLAQVIGGPDAKTLLFLAYFSFFINLLNLLPIIPFDGGHVVAAISRWLWPAGLALLAVAFVYTFNLLLLLLGALFFAQTIARFRVARREPYYAIGIGTRLYVSVLYVGLAVGLALALYVTQSLMPLLNLFGQ